MNRTDMRREAKRLRKTGLTYQQVADDFKRQGIKSAITGNFFSFGGIQGLVVGSRTKKKGRRRSTRRTAPNKPTNTTTPNKAAGIIQIIQGLDQMKIADSEKWAMLTLVI